MTQPSAEYQKSWRTGNKARCAAYQKRYRDRTPWYGLMRGARERANARGLAFDLDTEWARANWTGVCPVSGLSLVRNPGLGGAFNSPSIDRRNPRKGYTKDNCWFVANCVNGFKGSMSEDQFWSVLAQMVAYRLSVGLPVSLAA